MTQAMRAEPLIPGRPATAWREAVERLDDAGTYWLVTTGPDRRTHVVPVLAVLVDGTLHFAASDRSRKARNLAANPDCVISTSATSMDLVVHGRATKIRQDDRLRDVAAAYARKYDWHVAPRDGAFHDAEGAPTAGPPPYEVYAVTVTRAYGFATSESVNSTRWRPLDGHGF